MMRESVTAQQVVDLLNEILKAHPRAVSQLFNYNVFCNHRLANHSTVQVGSNGRGDFTLGPLGIINGMFGTHPNGYGPIARDVDEEGHVVGFSLTTGKEHGRSVRRKARLK